MTEILSGKAAGQHAYRTRTPRAMLTPTMTLAVSNVSCLAMCTAGKVWSELTSEAFQRLCPTATFVLTTAVGHDPGGRLGAHFQITPKVTVRHPPSISGISVVIPAPPLTLGITEWLWSDSEKFEILGLLTGPW